ncbi:MAG: AAA family ATPase, partial [Verrucomicrobia bacterium]|nr:AAA family ATPase [Verrucomicrobiota bacterium]
MKRLIDLHLRKWKQDSGRKPLLLRGARLVGKTFAVREFGKSFKQFIEINFECNERVREIFEKKVELDLIIQKLNLLLDVDMLAEDTLLFLDEIQECPLAMELLVRFQEKIPSLKVIAAGSF